MKPVGYLVQDIAGCRHGDGGIYYNYILAGNGLFIEADGNLLSARVPVAQCEVRGLPPLEPEIRLVHGKIPQALFDLALADMLKMPDFETYLSVSFADGYYHLMKPGQEPGHATVTYNNIEGTVMDLHSHGFMAARFSGQDNADEQGFRLSCVIGQLRDTLPVVRLRVGVYGCFHALPWNAVFAGALTGATETEPVGEEGDWEKEFVHRLERATEILKERHDELQGIFSVHQSEGLRGWLRRHRLPGF